MGEEFGGKWIHVYVCLSLFTVSRKLSQYCLLIGSTPMQNEKFKKKWEDLENKWKDYTSG